MASQNERNQQLSLDAKRMRVVATGSSDGIDANTVFAFRQSGETVWASYSGGNIVQGFLIGTAHGSQLEFDYIQVTRAGRRDKGASNCTLERSPDTGLLQLTERFQWASRENHGVNRLQELGD